MTFALTLTLALVQAADESHPQQSVPVTLPLGFEAYSQPVLDTYKGKGGGRAHEAAFDAYITGVAFLHLRSLLGETTTVAEKGKIALFRSLYAVSLCEGDDELVSSGPVVHLSEFSADIKTVDLQSCLSEHEVHFMWIDDNSAFAVFEDANVTMEAATAAFSEAPFPVKVQSHADFRAAAKAESPKAETTSPGSKKRKR